MRLHPEGTAVKKILLFSRDPGGANTIIPLIDPLLEKGYAVTLFGKDVALRKYETAGLEGVDIMSVIDSVTPDSVVGFLRSEPPDIVITGTSADDFTEKYLWQAAEELCIPSLAILDQWTNYGIRFSPYAVADIREYELSKTHPYLPTRIIAMDDHAKTEMVAEGLPKGRIVICGQPYFETLFAAVGDSEAGVRFCKANAVDPADYVVVFASEPIRLTYGTKGEQWGYTEHSIFSSLVRGLETVAENASNRKIVVVIRPHPKENRDGLCDIIRQSGKIRWLVDTESSPWALINRADLVCGMSSMFLIESVILCRPTLSIQIGLNRENSFILDRRGIMKSILTETELQEQLHRTIIDGVQQEHRFDVIRNPVNRVLAEMEKLICQSLQ
jgi:hypothetical protein